MLSPEYLAQCTSYLLGMMDLVNEQLVADIARRIVKTGALTESAQFEAEKLTQQNILYKDIVNDISKVSGLTEAEITRIFEEANFENMESENLRAAIAGKTPIDHASNVAMGNLLSSHIRKTKGVVKNLTRTTASQGQNAFINAVNLANMQVSSGAFTYDFAIKNAIKQVAKSGLTVQYPTGHIDRLDVAVRRAVLTGVNQSSAELNMLYCDEIGTDLVEVTAHSGARPSHADWQGGVYSLSGKSKGYGSFYDITGYGTGEGLCGWNCRHSFYAYYEGTERTYSKEYLDSLDSKTYEYGGETYTNYEAGQKQRSYERAIRAEKRYLAGLNSAYNEAKDDTLRQSLKYEMENSAVNLKRKEAELKHFCKATDRRIDTTRTQVHAVKDVSGKIVGFDRSAAQRARTVAIKHHTDWLKSIGAESSELKVLDKYYDAKYNNSPAYKYLMDYRELVKRGEITPLLGFRTYYAYSRAIQNNLVGIKTPLGFEIEGFASHFVGRVIGRAGTSPKYNRKGVPVEDLLTCLRTGEIGKTQINPKGEKSILLISDKCFISINPDKKILVQCNP
ncbi:MAG: phage minor capsid protein [[Eubacterium] sulci]|nr:phage minor capsid protein [[Eubacterium] sulci]